MSTNIGNAFVRARAARLLYPTHTGSFLCFFPSFYLCANDNCNLFPFQSNDCLAVGGWASVLLSSLLRSHRICMVTGHVWWALSTFSAAMEVMVKWNTWYLIFIFSWKFSCEAAQCTMLVAFEYNANCSVNCIAPIASNHSIRVYIYSCDIGEGNALLATYVHDWKRPS